MRVSDDAQVLLTELWAGLDALDDECSGGLDSHSLAVVSRISEDPSCHSILLASLFGSITRPSCIKQAARENSAANGFDFPAFRNEMGRRPSDGGVLDAGSNPPESNPIQNQDMAGFMPDDSGLLGLIADGGQDLDTSLIADGDAGEYLPKQDTVADNEIVANIGGIIVDGNSWGEKFDIQSLNVLVSFRVDFMTMLTVRSLRAWLSLVNAVIIEAQGSEARLRFRYAMLPPSQLL